MEENKTCQLCEKQPGDYFVGGLYSRLCQSCADLIDNFEAKKNDPEFADLARKYSAKKEEFNDFLRKTRMKAGKINGKKCFNCRGKGRVPGHFGSEVGCPLCDPIRHYRDFD